MPASSTEIYSKPLHKMSSDEKTSIAVTCSINVLHYDLLYLIVKYLTIDELLNLILTCKSLYCFCTSNTIIKHLTYYPVDIHDDYAIYKTVINNNKFIQNQINIVFWSVPKVKTSCIKHLRNFTYELNKYLGQLDIEKDCASVIKDCTSIEFFKLFNFTSKIILVNELWSKPFVLLKTFIIGNKLLLEMKSIEFECFDRKFDIELNFEKFTSSDWLQLFIFVLRCVYINPISCPSYLKQFESNKYIHKRLIFVYYRMRGFVTSLTYEYRNTSVNYEYLLC